MDKVQDHNGKWDDSRCVLCAGGNDDSTSNDVEKVCYVSAVVNCISTDKECLVQNSVARRVMGRRWSMSVRSWLKRLSVTPESTAVKKYKGAL